MRLWSIHPRYLDRQGLLALWREGLLAQKVLAGKTRGYKAHPQLLRFRENKDPLSLIGSYLHFVAEEARCRNYQFDRSKILKKYNRLPAVPVSRGQLKFETEHLLRKLKKRSPDLYKSWADQKRGFKPHPIFRAVGGDIELWERP